jgi:hypothetical protein
VVCWNTLSAAHSHADADADRQSGKAMRVLHVGNVKKNLADVQATIDVAARKIGEIAETSKFLRRKQVTDASFYAYLENVYGEERDKIRVKLKKIYEVIEKAELSNDALSEAKVAAMQLEEKLARPVRKESTLTRLTQLFIEGPGAELAGQTMWGAMSAVTHFEEHERTASNEARLASSWMGGNTAKIRDRALKVAIEMSV